MRLPSSFRFSAGLPILVAALFTSGLASARSFRVDDIPNGNERGCLNCHLTNNGENFNAFGTSVLDALVGSGATSQKHVDWSLVYDRDPDKDGYTSGQELGDPNGTWVIGDPDPPGKTYNPGDYESHAGGTCGNGLLQSDEDCEGTQMQETNCVDIGQGSGQLGCFPDTCSYDLSGCAGPPTNQLDASDRAPDDEGCQLSTGPAVPAGGCAATIGLLGLALAGRRRRRAHKASRVKP